MSKSIKLTKVFSHSIETIWAALTDAEAMSEWLMPCNIKPEKGYEFRFTTKPAPGFDGIVYCKILELQPPYLLTFSWTGGTLKDTLVSFKMTSITEENTRMDFEHSGFEGFLNNLIVRRMLAKGWKGKILNVQLPNYLHK